MPALTSFALHLPSALLDETAMALLTPKSVRAPPRTHFERAVSRALLAGVGSGLLSVLVGYTWASCPETWLPAADCTLARRADSVLHCVQKVGVVLYAVDLFAKLWTLWSLSRNDPSLSDWLFQSEPTLKP